MQELHQVVGDQVGHLQFLVGFRDPDLHGNLVHDALAQHRPRTFAGLFQVVFQAAAGCSQHGPAQQRIEKLLQFHAIDVALVQL